MPSRHTSRAIAAVTAAALCGCSLLTDLGGLSGGSSGTTATDAGSPTEGSTVPSDGAAGDSATDAGVDATTPTLCAPGTSHLFCSTFDKDAIGTIFDAFGTGNGGSLAIESTSAFSSPSSLRIGHPGGDTGDTPYASKTIGVNDLKGVRCRMRYRRETMGGGILVLFIVEMKTASSARFFAEVKDGPSTGKLYLETTKNDGAQASDFPDIPTVSSATNGWADIEWTLDFDASKSTLLRDGSNVDTRGFAAPFDGRSATTMKITVGLGLFQAPATPWVVRVDDLVCDAL